MSARARRAMISGLQPAGLAEALEGFARFRAARAAMGEWGRGTWAVQGARLTLTRTIPGRSRRSLARHFRGMTVAHMVT